MNINSTILTRITTAVRRSAACLLLTAIPAAASAQDLLARQAPIDVKMRAVDSLALQHLIDQDNLDNPAGDLYPSWENNFINAFANVELPQEYKIDLRHFAMPTTNRIVTSRYGYRPRFRRQHKGLDINANRGDTIRAAFDGKVRIVDYQPKGYGNVVVIRHPNGLETVYGHLSRHLVKQDSTVKAGDPIGLAGNTGFSKGTHLHFETRLLGEYIDPAKLFDFEHQDVTGDYYVFRGRGRGTLLGRHDANGSADGMAGQTEEEVSYASSELARKPAATRSRTAASAVHKVRRGDTLSSIAKRYHTTVSKLCSANGLTPKSTLKVGQIIRCS